MGHQGKKTQTELGIRYVYQYFLLSIILNLLITVYALVLFIQGVNLIDYSNSNISFLFIWIFFTLFTMIWLIRGLISFFNGRTEYNEDHESYVIIATILIIVYITILLFNLIYSKGYFGGAALISAISTGFSSINTIPFIVNIAISTVAFTLFGFAMVYLIFELAHPVNKKKVWFWVYFLILGSFTFNISYFIGLLFIYKVFKETYQRIDEGWVKTADTAPCPKCGRDVSVESKTCPYCSLKFRYDPGLEVDPKFTVNIPKAMYVAPRGYTPTKGVSVEEKRRLMYILAGVISAIILIVVIFTLI